MKPAILLLALTVTAFFSCTTAYKSGQTPDDVYYSAAKPQPEDEEIKKDDDKDYSYNDEYYDDRYIRMKVQNRYRWNDLNDWYYYDRYSLRYNYYFGNYNNPYTSWNYYYNPYCCCHNSISVINYKLPAAAPVVKRPFSLAGYSNNSYNNSNNTSGTMKMPVRTTQRSYNNSNRSLSEKVRNIFNTDNSSTRTYQPSSNSSSGNNSSSSSSSSNNNNSSSGKSGSSGTTVTRPTRN